MEVHLNPDTEKKLRDLAAQSGRGTDELVEDAVAGYFDDVLQVRQHIEEGYSQAQRGELIDGDQARREIQAMKIVWRQEHSRHQ
jgi:predicted transcriptional regulator